MDKTDRIKVFLHDCETLLRVGVYTQELDAPQPVVINIELETDQTEQFTNKAERALDRVLDYEKLYNFVTIDLPKMGHIYLLESVAEHIAEFCLGDPRVQIARIRLEKTKIFPKAAGAGIEITRFRKGAA